MRPTTLAVIALPLLLAAAPARRDLSASIRAAVPDAAARAVELRRAIHAHPELGEREHETASLVAERLRELGYDVRTGVAGTGVVATLAGGRPGPVVAWRADMDALPITEETGLPFASTRTDTWGGKEVGVMHACGHDVHTAIALGVAEVLAGEDVRAELPGTVKLLFQPAEEGVPHDRPYGAQRMVQEGALEDPRPDAVLGLHGTPYLEVGQVAALAGPALAAADRFTIRVEGKQTHGAYPQDGVDPILVASHVVIALQAIASREVDTRQSVVVSVGKVEAGNRFNVIPASATLVGTIRTHEPAVRTRVHERVRAIAEGVAAAYRASAEVTFQGMTPATHNDPALRDRALPALIDAVGQEQLVSQLPSMGGEDFAHLANEVPGLYLFLGVAPPGEAGTMALHTPTFSPDEGAIEVGIRTAALTVGHLLREGETSGEGR